VKNAQLPWHCSRIIPIPICCQVYEQAYMYEVAAMYKVAAAYKKLPAYVVALLLAFLWWPVADAARNFPQDARRGTITEHQYPHYQIDSSTYRIAAGGRIINQKNMIIMPVSFYGKAEVMYRLDMRGELSVIWLLTREEAALHPKRVVPIVPEGTNGR
jgi:hypothetical protein